MNRYLLDSTVCYLMTDTHPVAMIYQMDNVIHPLINWSLIATNSHLGDFYHFCCITGVWFKTGSRSLERWRHAKQYSVQLRHALCDNNQIQLTISTQLMAFSTNAMNN